MQSLKDISIKKKLVLMIMQIVMSAMSVACTAFVVNDVLMIKKDMVEQMTALAEILGTTASPALRNGDNRQVQQLVESLDVYPAVRTAVVYDADFDTVIWKSSRESSPRVERLARYTWKAIWTLSGCRCCNTR
jgi:hypothetical protein